MEIEFPIEFIVHGRAVSHQAKRTVTKDEWKERVKAASTTVIPQPHFASKGRMALTIYNFPEGPMQGDADNIVKLVVDALSRHIYIDDPQVERVVVQKFEPGNVFEFASPSEILARALVAPKPLVYIRVSNDPFEELA
jgi:Holliday junction resolvase RusA-like endonuclease